jgi:hypothetical protein
VTHGRRRRTAVRRAVRGSLTGARRCATARPREQGQSDRRASPRPQLGAVGEISARTRRERSRAFWQLAGTARSAPGSTVSSTATRWSSSSRRTTEAAPGPCANQASREDFSKTFARLPTADAARSPEASTARLRADEKGTAEIARVAAAYDTALDPGSSDDPCRYLSAKQDIVTDRTLDAPAGGCTILIRFSQRNAAPPLKRLSAAEIDRMTSAQKTVAPRIAAAWRVTGMTAPPQGCHVDADEAWGREPRGEELAAER